MKKNKAMRAAGGLFVATMLSTSIISGTYAKYVTEGGANDSARVAKFGVVITAGGELFSKNYYAVGGTNSNQPAASGVSDNTEGTLLTVESSDDAKVVAPGTKSDPANPMKISVTGTPEVDVRVKFTLDTTNNEDIFLAANEDLPDMTTAVTTDTFNNTTAYYPIVYTLTADLIKNSDTTIATGDTYGTIDKTAGTAKGNLTQITAVINAINGTNGIYVDANKSLDTVIGNLSLTWEWAFGDAEGVTQNDKQDTLLGDLAASTTLTPDIELTDGEDYNLDVKFGLTVSVTQVD